MMIIGTSRFDAGAPSRRHNGCGAAGLPDDDKSQPLMLQGSLGRGSIKEQLPFSVE